MEAIAAFGIACNVIQVISFTRETIVLCKEIYTSGTTHKGFEFAEDTVRQYGGFCDELQEKIAETGRGGSKSVRAEEKELLELAKNCLKAANDLKAKTAKLVSASAKGSAVRSAYAGVSAKWNEGRLKKLEDVVNKQQALLESRLLMKVCKTTDAIAMQQDDKFTALDGTLRTFVRNIAEGQRSIERLLSIEAASIKLHTTNEIAVQTVMLKAHLSNKITNIALAIDEKESRRELRKATTSTYDKLLRSLKYEGLEERRHQVATSHEGTLEWIYDSRGGTKPLRYKNSKSQLVDDIGPAQPKKEEETRRLRPRPLPLPQPQPLPQVLPLPQPQPLPQPKPKQEQSAGPKGMTTAHTCSPSSTMDWDCFACWLEQPHGQPYWFSGKAGSGKSTLIKFLIENEETRRSLEAAHGPAVILSHFIWLSGQPIQRGMRGILLSLLHQFLSHSHYPVNAPSDLYDQLRFQETVDTLLLALPKATSKESQSDWSYDELRNGLMAVLGASSEMVCIFVDGLDEVESELQSANPRPVLDLVGKLCELPSVKVCVSSRPESAFRKHFRSCRQLALQDLTRDDIMNYVIDHIQPCVPYASGSEAEVYTLARKLWKCSDGVFLWVCLVTRSFLVGLTNGDTVSELIQRLEFVPRNINNLYESMWQRLGEDDRAIYRKEASLYINFMLDWMKEDTRQLHTWYEPMFDVFSGVHCFAATHPERPWEIIDHHENYSWDDIEKLGQDHANRVETRTAGLLEAAKREHGRLRLAFPHRSAKEFFTNTEAGREFLRYDTQTESERLSNIFQGGIVCFWMNWIKGLHRANDVTQTLGDFLICLQDAWYAGIFDQKKTLSLVRLCRHVHRAAYTHQRDLGQVFRPGDYELSPAAVDFNLLLAEYGCGMFLTFSAGSDLGEEAISQARSRTLPLVFSDQYKAVLLNCMLKHWSSADQYPRERYETIEWLLSQGMVENRPRGLKAPFRGPAATLLDRCLKNYEPLFLSLLRKFLLLDGAWEDRLAMAFIQFNSDQNNRFMLDQPRYAVDSPSAYCCLLAEMPMAFAVALLFKKLPTEIQLLPEYASVHSEVKLRCPCGPPPAQILAVRFHGKEFYAPSKDHASLHVSDCFFDDNGYSEFCINGFVDRIPGLKMGSLTTAERIKDYIEQWQNSA